MAENLDILNTAISLLVRAALLAAQFSGRIRKRSLKRLAAMNTDTKAIKHTPVSATLPLLVPICRHSAGAAIVPIHGMPRKNLFEAVILE